MPMEWRLPTAARRKPSQCPLRRGSVAMCKQGAPPLPLPMLAGRYTIIILVFAFLLPAPLAVEIPPSDCDGNKYAANSTFQANLNLLAAALPVNASVSPAGFATLGFGTAPAQANGLALCRGDTNASTCAACVAAAFQDAQQLCPLYMGATVYRGACVLRFANWQFLDFLKEGQWLVSEFFPSIGTSLESVNASDAWFSAAVTGIFRALVDRAVATSNATRKYFATGEMDFDPKLYGLAQCVPDLTLAQCRECLQDLVTIVTTQYLSGRPPSINAFVVWCSLIYSVSPVYDGRAMLQLAAPPVPPPSATFTSPSSGKKRSAAGISAGVACSIAFMLIISVICFLRFQRRINSTENDHPLKKIGRAQCTIFDLPTLLEATEHFSENNKLGEGGFGTVYKGILSDGQEIAVKTLLGRTREGLQQLHNEVLVLAELQHKNLVRLHGFCLHQSDTLLVYEYIKNGSLDNFLFDDSNGNALNWEQQYNIIIGIAKGILYLHEDSSMRIIHRDLKANNILLDDNMEPKIADFGLARLIGEGHTHTQTARVVGTFGYMAPEYAMQGSVSPKIDVFSFGVLVLEIVTRRSNCSSDDHSTVNLLSDVWDHWSKGTMLQMLHPSLDEVAQSQALRCIHIGLLCVQSKPEDRPDISVVVFMLTRDSMGLQLPSQPAFFFGRESPLALGSDARSSYTYDRSGFILEQGLSVNEVTLSELYPR
ncbi:cysteine-rich receptor-like protein kinase 10 [Sorghum bicolor]|uniref:cysteine-rich receptor-like protein kinase 10 n=1 Tax=Sorghum bicolor TaxID=4558 RepID=UPI00081ABD2E|nr:cysteine-rich receptor-like protein kinase 10 [Sorghum bicolor]|eukprot:XP_021307784.1 cysteine-rich receptor-like protein kinase 10 [Sorghum bicolor]